MRQSDLRVELTRLMIKYKHRYDDTRPREANDIKVGLIAVLNSNVDDKQKLRDVFCFAALSLQLYMNFIIPWSELTTPPDVTEMIFKGQPRELKADPFVHIRITLSARNQPFDERLIEVCMLCLGYIRRME